MNILYVSQRVPYPPNRGDKIAAYHAIRFLARRHVVTVAALADSQQELEHAEALHSQGFEVLVELQRTMMARVRVAKALVAGEALSVAHYHSPTLQRRVENLVRQGRFDVAIAFSSTMGQYVPERLGLPLIADFVDMDSRKWDLYASVTGWPRSWLYATEAQRLLNFERDLALRAQCTLVSTETERQDCVRLIPGARVEILRNGVDLDYFSPDWNVPRGRQLVFTGVMDYFPNIQAVTYFCDEVFPLVRRKVADATFVIVGARPTKEVLALRDRPGVTVTGPVPDVRPYLKSSAIAVVPLLLARGVQNKVLEAMAMGLPVVSTHPAFQGAGAPEGEGILVAKAAADFAELVVGLLEDPSRADQLGRRARDFVERNCVWEDHLSRLEALVIEIANGSKKGA